MKCNGNSETLLCLKNTTESLVINEDTKELQVVSFLPQTCCSLEAILGAGHAPYEAPWPGRMSTGRSQGRQCTWSGFQPLGPHIRHRSPQDAPWEDGEEGGEEGDGGFHEVGHRGGGQGAYGGVQEDPCEVVRGEGGKHILGSHEQGTLFLSCAPSSLG